MIWEPCETIRLWFFVRSRSPNQIPWRQVVPMIQTVITWSSGFPRPSTHLRTFTFKIRGSWCGVAQVEHGETSTVFVVARSAKRNNHDPHDLLVGFRRVDDIFFRYDGMSANATGMIWRTLLVALARVGKVILTSFTFGENTNILRGYREAKM